MQSTDKKKIDDLKIIKSYYGEKFAKLCRELFPSILDKEGYLVNILKKYFDNTPTLYTDISPVKEDFRDFIYNSFNENIENQIETDLSPKELLDKAGYYLFPECKTERDIQKFKKYYKREERLCTFRGKRLNTCRVWFAVKKELLDDTNAIKRGNPPQRQDNYGTSVISIQFTKGEHSYLSIKNRYNHSVTNPDCTFNNNLDNIVLGLTYSFCNKFGLNLTKRDNYSTSSFFYDYMIDRSYAQSNDEKFYKIKEYISTGRLCYNNNIVKVDGTVVNFDKSTYTMFGTYLLSHKHKRIVDLNKFQFMDNETVENSFDFLSKNEDTNNKITDSFIKSIGKIEKIKIGFNKNKNKVITITPEKGKDVIIVLDNLDNMIGYANPNVVEISDSFLYNNTHLRQLSLPNVKTIGNGFLCHNESLEKIYLPNVEKIGDQFLTLNKNITEISLPKVKTIGSSFLYDCKKVNKIDLPNVTQIGNFFNNLNSCITKLSLPNVEKIGVGFMSCNNTLTSIDLPSVKEIDKRFLLKNKKLKDINIPKIENVGIDFLLNNRRRKNILKKANLIKKKNLFDYLPFWYKKIKM